jgi:anti-anti-sigma regulatory factor
MSQKFQATVHQREDVTFVKLAGVIDEDNELSDLAEKIGAGTCVIDLSEVERINSCGVRDWVNWLGRIEVADTDVVLVECSPAIVAQINLVNNFTGSGAVKSFYVPYFCPECDEEKVLLCEAADMGPPPHEPPTCRCDECDLVMDFDDMPDSYFAFLGHQKKLPEPARIQAVVNQFNSTDGEKSKIRSRVGATSMANASLASSLPSVPSLPSLSRSGLAASAAAVADAGGGGHPGITSAANSAGLAFGAAAQSAVQPRNGAVVYVLVAVLLVAIAVLGFLLLSK